MKGQHSISSYQQGTKLDQQIANQLSTNKIVMSPQPKSKQVFQKSSKQVSTPHLNLAKNYNYFSKQLAKNSTQSRSISQKRQELLSDNAPKTSRNESKDDPTIKQATNQQSQKKADRYQNTAMNKNSYYYGYQTSQNYQSTPNPRDFQRFESHNIIRNELLKQETDHQQYQINVLNEYQSNSCSGHPNNNKNNITLNKSNSSNANNNLNTNNTKPISQSNSNTNSNKKEVLKDFLTNLQIIKSSSQATTPNKGFNEEKKEVGINSFIDDNYNNIQNNSGNYDSGDGSNNMNLNMNNNMSNRNDNNNNNIDYTKQPASESQLKQQDENNNQQLKHIITSQNSKIQQLSMQLQFLQQQLEQNQQVQYQNDKNFVGSSNIIRKLQNELNYKSQKLLQLSQLHNQQKEYYPQLQLKNYSSFQVTSSQQLEQQKKLEELEKKNCKYLQVASYSSQQFFEQQKLVQKLYQWLYELSGNPKNLKKKPQEDIRGHSNSDSNKQQQLQEQQTPLPNDFQLYSPESKQEQIQQEFFHDLQLLQQKQQLQLEELLRPDQSAVMGNQQSENQILFDLDQFQHASLMELDNQEIESVKIESFQQNKTKQSQLKLKKNWQNASKNTIIKYVKQLEDQIEYLDKGQDKLQQENQSKNMQIQLIEGIANKTQIQLQKNIETVQQLNDQLKLQSEKLLSYQILVQELQSQPVVQNTQEQDKKKEKQYQISNSDIEDASESQESQKSNFQSEVVSNPTDQSPEHATSIKVNLNQSNADQPNLKQLQDQFLQVEQQKNFLNQEVLSYKQSNEELQAELTESRKQSTQYQNELADLQSQYKHLMYLLSVNQNPSDSGQINNPNTTINRKLSSYNFINITEENTANNEKVIVVDQPTSKSNIKTEQDNVESNQQQRSQENMNKINAQDVNFQKVNEQQILKIKELESQLFDMTSSKNGEIEQLKIQIQSKQEQIDKLEQEIKCQTQSALEKSEQLTQVTTKNAELQQLLDNQMQQISEYQNKTQQYSKMQDDQSQFQEKLANLTQKLEEATESKKKIKKDFEKFTSEKTEQIEFLQIEKQTLTQKYKKLEQADKTSAAEFDKKLEEKTKLIEEMKSQIDQLTKDNENLKQVQASQKNDSLIINKQKDFQDLITNLYQLKFEFKIVIAKLEEKKIGSHMHQLTPSTIQLQSNKSSTECQTENNEILDELNIQNLKAVKSSEQLKQLPPIQLNDTTQELGRYQNQSNQENDIKENEIVELQKHCDVMVKKIEELEIHRSSNNSFSNQQLSNLETEVDQMHQQDFKEEYSGNQIIEVLEDDTRSEKQNQIFQELQVYKNTQKKNNIPYNNNNNNNSELEQTINQLKIESRTKSETIVKLEQDLSQSRKNLEQQNQEINALQTNVQRLEKIDKDNQLIKDKIKELIMVNNQMLSKNTQLEEEIKAQKQQFQQEKLNSRNQVSQLMNEIQQKDSEIAGWKLIKVKYDKDIEYLQQRGDNLENEKNNIIETNKKQISEILSEMDELNTYNQLVTDFF